MISFAINLYSRRKSNFKLVSSLHIKRKNVFFDYIGLEIQYTLHTHTPTRTHEHTHVEYVERLYLCLCVCLSESSQVREGDCSLIQMVSHHISPPGSPTSLRGYNAHKENVSVIVTEKGCKASRRCEKLPILSDFEQRYQLTCTHTHTQCRCITDKTLKS